MHVNFVYLCKRRTALVSVYKGGVIPRTRERRSDNESYVYCLSLWSFLAFKDDPLFKTPSSLMSKLYRDLSASPPFMSLDSFLELKPRIDQKKFSRKILQVDAKVATPKKLESFPRC